MSTKTGLAPTYKMQLAEATKEKGVVMTSSPGAMPAAIMAAWRPAVPEETPIAVAPAGRFGAGTLEFLDFGADGEGRSVEDIDDGVDLDLRNIRLRERDGCWHK